MGKHIVIDGNAFYEVDEDCLRKMRHRGEDGMMSGGSRKTEETMSGTARPERMCRGRKGRR